MQVNSRWISQPSQDLNHKSPTTVFTQYLFVSLYVSPIIVYSLSSSVNLRACAGSNKLSLQICFRSLNFFSSTTTASCLWKKGQCIFPCYTTTFTGQNNLLQDGFSTARCMDGFEGKEETVSGKQDTMGRTCAVSKDMEQGVPLHFCKSRT